MKLHVAGYEVEVDDEDAWRITSERWGIQKHSTPYKSYAYVRKYETVGKRTTARLLHREIAGAKRGEIVDHINGNPLDNRKANLRVCTHAQNMQNRARHGNNTSGYKGVYWCSEKSKFRAALRINGKKVHAGYALTAQEAARMYDAKAREIFGDFARVNATEAVTV